MDVSRTEPKILYTIGVTTRRSHLEQTNFYQRSAMVSNLQCTSCPASLSNSRREANCASLRHHLFLLLLIQHSLPLSCHTCPSSVFKIHFCNPSNKLMSISMVQSPSQFFRILQRAAPWTKGPLGTTVTV